MVNYQNGKIYKIINDSMPGMVYYGSTCNTFAKRMTQHKAPSSHCKSKILLEYGNPQMILIEKYPCNDKMELTARERYYIDNNNCVNKIVPGRTNKEYYEDNKEKIKEHYEDNKEQILLNKKEYYEANKEKILLKKKEQYEANKEQILLKKKEYQEANKEKISLYQKEHYEANKEKLNKKIDCECGGKYTYTNKSTHFKSKKHQAFISS